MTLGDGSGNWDRSSRRQSAWRLARYLLLRAGGILLTIFIGTFITMVIANNAVRGWGQVDGEESVPAQMEAQANLPPGFWEQASATGAITPEMEAVMNALFMKYEQKYGLTQPPLQRNLRWTWRALTFNLGQNVRNLGYKGPVYGSPKASAVILSAFPRTLLVVGIAFVLLFFAGIPLSLYLFRKHGSLLDRFLTLLAPLSSIPSWVLGMVLVLIFAVGLHLLPPSGWLDASNPVLSWRTLPQLLLHLVLPVSAIFLSLFFQLIYTWKTFFLQFAGEDYVELAKAKGLPQKQVERQYILRPTITYIITSFTMLMATFWQLSIALEYIFDWPGVGKLFITSLPNTVKYANTAASPVYYGVMVIVVEIVVLFAYILGVTAFSLDLVYALVDPRFRVGLESQTVQGGVVRGMKFSRPKVKRGEKPYWKQARSIPALAEESPQTKKTLLQAGKAKKDPGSFKPILKELWHFPSAIFGLTVILLLIGGSIAAVTIYPYQTLGKVWYEQDLSGRPSIPRIANPTLINFFRKDPFPPSIFMKNGDGRTQKTVENNPSSPGKHIVITYPIDFNYGGFPSEMTLYFTSKYSLKKPFASLSWQTPDGRTLQMDNIIPQTGIPYSFNKDLLPDRLLSNFPNWQEWFHFAQFSSAAFGSTGQATPTLDLLFADPSAHTAKVQPGKYTLKLDIFTFEDDSDVDAELDILGQVYGLAGTDYLRRELIVPLLWGMPFALALGLIGALLTTVVSMLLSATGVFFGGWFDQAIQRTIEAVLMLPVIAIGVIGFINYNLSIWVFLALIALLNVFGSPTKSFRAALLQIKDNPYIEWARASGASNFHIIKNYFLPNILPMFVPQIVALIPSYVFLEATLGIFGVKSQYPTWGRVIYDALRYGGLFGSSYWVFEPIALLLVTGLAFAMLGFALERILNPRLKNV